jgi:hypothetical protein
MPSPFPGMDPYLEIHWRDVHHRLITYISDALRRKLPKSLRARVEERVVMETASGIDSNPLFPDVRVVERRPDWNESASASSGIAVAEPLLIEAFRELTEGFIEIIDHGTGNRVVTVIEVLSPTNKIPGDGFDQYMKKQQELCQSDTNLVEIDLVRRGRHVVAVPRDRIPERHQTPYLVCVRRATNKGIAEVYPVPLQLRLPIIKIPLRNTDADVTLDLQALIDLCYDLGGYDDWFDYAADANPPLTGADAEWADALLRERGLRAAKPAKRKRKPRGRR